MAYTGNYGRFDSVETETEYFAAKSAEEAIPVLKERADAWFDTLINNSYLDKVKRGWMAYYGIFFDGTDSGHNINFGGEQGELANIAVNHYRNIASHILTMITSNRPSFETQAVNRDYKSQIQTKLGDSLLEYYMKKKKLTYHLKIATEQAISMSTGYVKMEWNSEIGEIYDYTDNGYPIYQGDVVFSNPSIFDVVFDSSKESSNMDWVIVRSWKNKFDLAAKYPELAKKIKGLKTKDAMSRYKLTGASYDKTTDVPVYEFFHKRTEALPEGRYLLYLEDDIILMDAPMPYRELPVYRIAPSDILGTPYGYTPMFDLLPLQDALNMLYSIILTNQNAFGVQSIYVPRGADITTSSLIGGMNIIEGNLMNGAGIPTPIQLTSTPGEIFKFIETIKADMETISGVNAVARGNTPPNLESGAALALVQTQALQFMSGLQQSYIELIEDVGTGLIHMLQDFASAPRLAAIVGKNNQSKMDYFSSEDINQIDRVYVNAGNALATTTAGRMAIAEQLMQMKADEMSVAQYMNIIENGRLEVMTANTTSQLELAQRENEELMEGRDDIRAIITEQHWLHINEHQSILGDPELKRDDALVQRVLAHISDHLEQLRNGDPELLMGLKQQPLGQGVPPQPGMEGGAPPEDGGQMPAPGSPEALAAGQAAPTQPPPPGQAMVPQVPPELTAQGGLPLGAEVPNG